MCNVMYRAHALGVAWGINYVMIPLARSSQLENVAQARADCAMNAERSAWFSRENETSRGSSKFRGTDVLAEDIKVEIVKT